jgi:LysM repeat protein
LIAALVIPALPAVAQDGGPRAHVVQPDENLFRIALRYGVTVEALMRANDLSEPNLVIVGQTLIIPASGNTANQSASVPAAPVGSAYRTHVVAPGEYLLDIARRYGVTAEDIIRANNIVNPSLLAAGQVLVIPDPPAQPAADPGIPGPPAEPVADLGIAGPPAEPSPVQIAPSGDDLGILAPDGVALPDIPPATGNAAPDASAAPPILPDDSASAPDSDESEAPSDGMVPGALDPSLTTDDLGILPPGGAPPGANTAPPDPMLSSPDLGIIAPGAANWLLQPGIISTGGPRVREIYLRGQALGNDPNAFSKIGDCNSEPPFFLAKFDTGEYNLGDYGYLQPVIDQFGGSFGRQSMAVWTGSHAWALFDPIWSNPATCQPGESPLACEFRLNRPSVVLIRLGTNEAGSPQLFETNLRRIVEFSIERGVIPILGTKADRIEGSDRNNEIIRALAEEYGVPLWDFGRIADTLPGRGLLADGFHLGYFPPDYRQPAALVTGHPVQNLTALMALHTVWRTAMQ